MRWKAVQGVLWAAWENHDECRDYYMEVPGFCRPIVRRRAPPGGESQGLRVCKGRGRLSRLEGSVLSKGLGFGGCLPGLHEGGPSSLPCANASGAVSLVTRGSWD